MRYYLTTASSNEVEVFEGDDVSAELGIVKYEAPIPASLAGEVKGMFPGVIPKTDQERCQNLTAELVSVRHSGMQFEITEKLDGSSMTVYKLDGEFGVCSRNLDLKRNADNTLWAVAIRECIEEKIMGLPYDLAIQGELVGPGIQGNIYKLSRHEFRVFDCYHINSGQYFSPRARRAFVESLELTHVPVIAKEESINVDIEGLLHMAEGMSVASKAEHVNREGLVFKSVIGGMTFKAISNKFLLKSGEK